MIREARPYDITDLVDLARQFHKETGYKSTFDKRQVQDTFELLIGAEHTVVLCFEQEGRVVGFLAGAMMPSFFSQSKTAGELAWFVRKESRGSSGSFRLIKEFEGWAVAQGCSDISLAMIEGVTDLTGPYTKMGYKLTEQTFTKRL